MLGEERLGGKGLLRLIEFVKLVNSVFSELGSSLLRCAVFHVLSLIDKNTTRKCNDESYWEQQELISPEYITNHSCRVSSTCNTNRSQLPIQKQRS